jgi:hypothetical protein
MLSDIAKDTSRPGRKRKPFDMAALQNARGEVSLGYRVLRNWDATAAHYGISKAAAHRLANDPNYRPSQATIDKVLATPRPVPPLVPVPPCPDCGSVHHARCNGNGGTAVVLAPGETVRRSGQSKPRPKVRRPWMGYELSAEMDVAGVTDATVRWLVTRYIYEQELAGHAPALEVAT